MNVSNSTGDNTGYRVVGSGAAPCPPPTKGGRQKKVKPEPPAILAPQTLHEGTLEPNTYVTLQMPDASACKVEFHRAGKKIAEQTVGQGKYEEVLIALIPNGRGAPKAFACRKKA
jgi:hypothetical protein